MWRKHAERREPVPNKRMQSLGKNRSVIRELFEYGKRRKEEIGEENVFDFSLGNPSVPSPNAVNDALSMLIKKKDAVSLHGYTSAQGDASVRDAVAKYINKTYGDSVCASDFYLTVGAAASLTVTLNALLYSGDEVILIAPFFPEYKVFVEQAGGCAHAVMSAPGDLQPDINAIRAAVNKKTRAIIINYPNNPTGAVITSENARMLAEMLEEESLRIGHPIYLISDEPYRELVYGDVKLPYIPELYKNTIVCYSFSKSLSLPGERIGYIMVSPRCEERSEVYEAVCGAGRALGFVCAPALFQYMIPHVLGLTSDISVYDRNRRLLYSALTEMGYEAVNPDGAFYLFLKAPNGDANELSERAKAYELLLVPSDSFGCKGYVRISYCVKTETVERALPAFKKLIESYRTEK